MKHRLSPRLSPQAKKAALRDEPAEMMSVLVQVAPQADADVVVRRLVELGATAPRFMPETRLLAADLPATALEAAAELPGVVYLELATRQRL